MWSEKSYVMLETSMQIEQCDMKVKHISPYQPEPFGMDLMLDQSEYPSTQPIQLIN